MRRATGSAPNRPPRQAPDEGTARAPRRWPRAVIAMLVLGAGCALARGPEDEPPTQYGGLPEGVRASPATPSTGGTGVTAPAPTDLAPPPPPGQPPLGTVDAARPGARVVEDSATRALRMRLDSALSIISGDPTKAQVSVARGLVDGFRRLLAGNQDPRLVGVREELAALHEQLGRSPVDPGAVGRTLERLGTRTAAAAPAAGVLAGRVARLGDLLSARGKQMAAGAR